MRVVWMVCTPLLWCVFAETQIPDVNGSPDGNVAPDGNAIADSPETQIPDVNVASDGNAIADNPETQNPDLGTNIGIPDFLEDSFKCGLMLGKCQHKICSPGIPRIGGCRAQMFHCCRNQPKMIQQAN